MLFPGIDVGIGWRQTRFVVLDAESQVMIEGLAFLQFFLMEKNKV